MQQHVYHKCNEERCVVCNGELQLCTICNQGESELEVFCPGKKKHTCGYPVCAECEGVNFVNPDKA